MAHKSGRQRREETETTASPDDDGEGVNPEARRLLLEVVDNQLRANDPRETRATYDRLMGEGHSPDEAKRLIALVLVVELNEMVRLSRTFDEAGYAAALRDLPALPYDE